MKSKIDPLQIEGKTMAKYWMNYPGVPWNSGQSDTDIFIPEWFSRTFHARALHSSPTHNGGPRATSLSRLTLMNSLSKVTPMKFIQSLKPTVRIFAWRSGYRLFTKEILRHFEDQMKFFEAANRVMVGKMDFCISDFIKNNTIWQ